MRRLKINLRLLWRKILREQGTPEAIGRGFAAGVVVGMTPLMGVQTLLALVAAWLVRGNPVAAVPPVWITNPFTAPPIFLVEYEVGRFVLLGWQSPGARERFEDFVTLVREGTAGHGFLEATGMLVKGLFELGGSVVAPLMAGGLTMGLLMALPSYFIVVRAVREVRRRRRQKRASYFREATEPSVPKGMEEEPHDNPLDT